MWLEKKCVRKENECRNLESKKHVIQNSLQENLTALKQEECRRRPNARSMHERGIGT